MKIDHPFNSRGDSLRCSQMYFDDVGEVKFCNKPPSDHQDYSEADMVAEYPDDDEVMRLASQAAHRWRRTLELLSDRDYSGGEAVNRYE